MRIYVAKQDTIPSQKRYMKEQNRPYSAQNVFDNLHGIVPKTQVQNLMEKLSKEPGSDAEPPLVMKE